MNLLKHQMADDDRQETDGIVPGDNHLLTRIEVAALLNVCPHTIARRTRSGELPCVTFSRRLIRYERATVRAFILAAQTHTKADPFQATDAPAAPNPACQGSGSSSNSTPSPGGGAQ